MRIATRIAEIEHPKGIRTALVPTMGAFHEGHLSLMRVAKRENDRLVVSLFVNPAQFGEGEDFSQYPRDFDRDLDLAQEIGVDLLFAPEIEEIYPRPGSTIHVPVVTERWEAIYRPTHFVGVATVVCKLFNIVRADSAYFGQKDLQQCLLIKRMVEDLNISIRLSFQPTVRESDGLAMSSRNAYLSAHHRSIAPLLYRQLADCRSKVEGLVSGGHRVTEIVTAGMNSLESAGFVVDYFDLIDVDSMEPTTDLSRSCSLIVAARLGNTRLIDNLPLSKSRSWIS